jgi:hypothetical protein
MEGLRSPEQVFLLFNSQHLSAPTDHHNIIIGGFLTNTEMVTENKQTAMLISYCNCSLYAVRHHLCIPRESTDDQSPISTETCCGLINRNGRGADKSLTLQTGQQSVGLKKCVYIFPLSSTHL